MEMERKYEGRYKYPTFKEWSYQIRNIVRQDKDADRKGFCQSIVDDIVGDLLWIQSKEDFNKVKEKWKAIMLIYKNGKENYSFYVQDLKEVRNERIKNIE